MMRYILLLLLCMFGTYAYPQTDTVRSLPKAKTGFSLGGIPVVGYNSDKGFLYGVAVNLYNFGDGSSYPNYKYSIFAEVSRTTKEGGINQVFFDSRELLPKKIRIIADVSLNTDKLLPFYGFNGYNALYNANFENQKHADYISRAYYRMDRRELRALTDVQGPMPFEHFRWVAGLGYQHFEMKEVDIENINKSLPEADKLPDVPGFYEELANAGIIKANEREGGDIRYIKAGAVFDTRDNEANPNKGIWAEGILMGTPSFLGNKFAFSQLGLILRHYFTIYPQRITMANRIGWQTKIAGTKPYFVQPYLYSTFRLVEAFGGAKTVRGVLANRIVADGVAFGNFELRYKVFISTLLKQDFYIAASSFFDWGIVTREYKIDRKLINSRPDLFHNREKGHYSSGAGIRFALNQNFIVAFDYGKALNPNDGNTSLYIGLDFLY